MLSPASPLIQNERPRSPYPLSSLLAAVPMAVEVLEYALFLSDYHLAAPAGFWTSIAVITAALSFWRITAAVGSRPIHKPNAPLQDPTPAPPPPAAEESTPAVCSCDDGWLRKGKFTVYYEDDGVEEEGGEMYEYADDIDRIRLPVVRTVDKGWQRYQDLTVLNGSAVRMWQYDGRKTSPL